MKYDYAVFIGRFQPIHAGHRAVIDAALKQANKLIIILGSHDSARTTRNPFTTSERERMILDSVSDEHRERILFGCVPDFTYNNDKWTAAIQGAVYSTIHRKWTAGPTSIALAGMHKDETSFYLNMFPTWDSIAVQPELGGSYFVADPTTNHDVECGIHASTTIRNKIFNDLWDLKKIDPKHYPQMAIEGAETMAEIISQNPEPFKQLMRESIFENEYKKRWGKGPHNTVDAVVVQAGYILLIQRGKEYGYKKWALPGGFINNNEFIVDAMVRELREETKIKVPEQVLRGSIVDRKVYDDPYRDLRSRNISHAFYIRLRDVGKLPPVKGSDDAIDARWFTISEFSKMRNQMFADHFCLISDMLKI